jgi:SAM-dependent methyltransferase
MAFRHWSKPTNPFSGSENYWIDRYASGGNSGFGSYNELSQFKAEVLNDFIFEKNIETVIEYGCGDGNQLTLATYRKYIGFDVSEKAIFMCRKIFENDGSRKFELLKKYNGEIAELTLSLDVIYHLVEDHVFSDYMERLFDSAKDYVIIYSSDTNLQEHEQSMHVRHRKFTDWVQINKLEWKLQQHIPNRYPPVANENIGSSSDFFIYMKNNI